MSLLDDFMGIGPDLGMDLFKQGRSEAMQEDAQNYNSDQAIASRGWQEYMRSTAYQASVDDMKKAGLNPMLAYSQGPTSTPSGQGASSGIGGTPGRAGTVAAGMQTAAQVSNIKADTEKKNAETENIRAQTPTHQASIDLMKQKIEESVKAMERMDQEIATGRATESEKKQHIENLKAQIPQIQATIKLLEQQAKQTGALTGKTEQETAEIRQRIRENLPALQRALGQLETQARTLAMPAREASAAAASSPAGAVGAALQAINPFNKILDLLR